MEEDSVCFKLSWKGGCNNYNKIKGRLYIFCFPMKLKKGERRIRRRRRRKGMKQKDKCEGNMGTSHVSCVLFTWKLIFSSVQSLSRVRLFATPWTAARQASLSITNSWSLPKPMSIESVMPSNHLILCRPHSLPALNISQHQGLFKWVSSSHQVAKVLEFQLQHQSFQWTPRTDLL